MGLSCSTDGDWSWYYTPPEDYTKLQSKKRKRCSSCKALIDIGAPVLEFEIWRDPKTDIEERISGSEVYMAPKYHCESCGDQFMNLSALGFCPDPSENMLDLLKQYHEEYGKGAIT